MFEGYPVPISASWYDDDQTIVIIRFEDPWELRDLSEAIQVSRQLIGSVEYTVDAIWDGTATNGAPSNIFSHFMVPNDDTTVPLNQGLVVVVVNTAFLKSFAALAKRLLPRITKHMHIVTNMQAAEAKIETVRAGR